MGIAWKFADRLFVRFGGLDLNKNSLEDLKEMFHDILNEGIHGISFSAYTEGQGPGTIISEQQVRERMKILQPHVRWVRSFSCIEGNEHIPKVARELGIKTLVGAWIGHEAEKNEQEINALINLAKAGYIDIIAIGNEVMLRGDQSEDQIIDYIQRVKTEVPGIPVGYVDAYFEFSAHPRITQACDVILVNCYPFWEGYPIEHALVYMKEMYRHAASVADGKKVIITETGWPNLGSPEELAIPSEKNALKYFIDAYTWAEQEDIEIFYFSSFDENWKIDKEGDVGAFWGIWDKDGHLKY